MMNGTLMLVLIVVGMMIVTLSPACIVAWVNVTVLPLTLTVPVGGVTLICPAWILSVLGSVSLICTGLTGPPLLFVTWIVQITVSPGAANGLSTPFVTVRPPLPPLLETTPPGAGGGSCAKPKSYVWSLSPKSPVVRRVL